jgi:hypothetical protein
MMVSPISLKNVMLDPWATNVVQIVGLRMGQFVSLKMSAASIVNQRIFIPYVNCRLIKGRQNLDIVKVVFAVLFDPHVKQPLSLTLLSALLGCIARIFAGWNAVHVQIWNLVKFFRFQLKMGLIVVQTCIVNPGNALRSLNRTHGGCIPYVNAQFWIM